MNVINNKIIPFKGKSRKRSEHIEIQEQVLTLKNLYDSYKKTLQQIQKLEGLEHSEELQELNSHMEVIEEHIAKLTGLLK